MSAPWIDIHLQWKIYMSPDMTALNESLVDLVRTAGYAWERQFPKHRELEKLDFEAFSEAIESQDKYPWLRGHLTAENIHTWHEEAMKRVLELTCIQYPYRNLVNYRFASVLKNKYVDSSPGIQEIMTKIAELRKREANLQFCNHPMCTVGVQIEVQTKDDASGELSIHRLLIGDLTPTGMDDGCCASGLKEDDVIIRYRDLRPLFKDE